jgi:hypothetical protein
MIEKNFSFPVRSSYWINEVNPVSFRQRSLLLKNLASDIIILQFLDDIVQPDATTQGIYNCNRK